MPNGGELTVNLPINVRVVLWWVCGVYWLLALLAVVLRRRSPLFRGAVKYGGRQATDTTSCGEENHVSSHDDKDGHDCGDLKNSQGNQDGCEHLTPLTSAHFARRRRSSSGGSDSNNAEDVVTTRLSLEYEGDSETHKKDGNNDVAGKSTFPSSPAKKNPPPLTPPLSPTTLSSPEANGPSQPNKRRSWMSGVPSSINVVSRKRAFISFYVVGCTVSSILIGILMFGVGYGWNRELPYIEGITDSSLFQCPSFAVSAPSHPDRRSVVGVSDTTTGGGKVSSTFTNGMLINSQCMKDAVGRKSRTTLSGLLLPTAITVAAYDRHVDLAMFHLSPPGGGMSTIMPSGGNVGAHRLGGRVLVQYGGEEVHVADKHTTDRQYIISQLLLDLRLQVLSRGGAGAEEEDGKPDVVLNKSIACCPPTHPKLGGRGGGAGAKRRGGSPFSSTADDAPKRECLCRPTAKTASSVDVDLNRKCWMSTPGVVPPPSWFVLLTAITPLSLFILHCLVRLYECNFIFVFRDSSNTIDLNVVVPKSTSDTVSTNTNTASSTITTAVAVSPDVVTLFAAVSGCTFYVVAPISLAVTSLEILIKFVEVGLSALMRSGEVAAVSGFGVPPISRNGGGEYSAPLPINPPAGASLLDTAVFGGGVLLVGFVVLLIFTLIFVFLQGLQLFHHVTLARLQRSRLSERRARIDEYRKELLSTHRRRSLRKSSSTTDSSSVTTRSTAARRVSVATGLPPDLEPAYIYPYQEGLFKHILEPHYSLEVCMYVCIAVLTITLCLYAECLAQLTQTNQASSSVDIGTLRLDASYRTTPIPIDGDFALWGIPNIVHHAPPSYWGTIVLPSTTNVDGTSVPSIAARIVEWMVSVRGMVGEMVSGLLSFDTIPLATLPVALLRYTLFFCRTWAALVPTVLVALFTLFNLNTTAQEHREFWVLVAGVVEIPRYNLIPWVL